MSAALFEMAVHMSMEVCSGDAAKRAEYVEWYIKTKGGTSFPIEDWPIYEVDAPILAPDRLKRK